MNQKIVIGNWKNYLNYEESISLSKAIFNIDISKKIRLMISPNHLYLIEVNEILLKTNIEVIAQNLTSSKSSSDTGGVTAVNLINLNVNRSIIACLLYTSPSPRDA